MTTIELLTAIAAMIAAVVALAAAAYRAWQWFTGPRLYLSWDPAYSGEWFEYQMGYWDEPKKYRWFRVQVRNTGRRPALECSAHLHSLSVLEGESYIPAAGAWGEVDLYWAFAGGKTVVRIDPAPKPKDAITAFGVDAEEILIIGAVFPTGYQYSYPPGDYRLTITVKSKNAPTVSCCLQVKFDGDPQSVQIWQVPPEIARSDVRFRGRLSQSGLLTILLTLKNGHSLPRFQRRVTSATPPALWSSSVLSPQLKDRDLGIGIDADLAGDLQALADDFRRGEVGMRA